MRFRPLLALVLPLTLVLGACGDRLAGMHINAPPVAYTEPQFKDAIAVGQVTGGASSGWLDTTSVTNDDFKNVLIYALHDAGVLAPDMSVAHWRLDALLQFSPAQRSTFTDQQVDTNITYSLSTVPEGKAVFQRLIRTSDTEATDTSKQIITFLLGGLEGLDAAGRVRLRVAYEATVRRSLGTFLLELRKWAEAGEPASDAIATVTTTAPPPQAAPVPPTAPAAPQVATLPPTPAPTPQNSAPSPQNVVAPPTPAKQVAALPAAPPPPPHDPVRFGNEVAFRCPTPGTEIDFRSGAQRVFAAEEPSADACALQSAAGVQPAIAFGPYNDAAAEALRRLWPLRVGNSVSFTATVSIERHLRETYRVVRHELVTVPAGTFDAFVIEWESVGQDQYTNGYHETATFWYAPEVGYVVKTVDHLVGGIYAQLGSDEAVRVIAR